MNALLQFATENQILAGSMLTICGTLIGIVLKGVLDRRATESAKRIEIENSVAKCELISLYAKVVRWEISDGNKAPLYSADATRIEALPVDVAVFDETVYTNVAVYDRPTEGHEYIFRGSGVVDLMCVSPWRDKLRYPDQGAAKDPHLIRQAFSDQPANTYVVVTHAYNGLQLGNEDFGTRMPVDAAEGRLVVDLSSVPHIIDAMTQLPTAELRGQQQSSAVRLQVYEYRRGIYVIEAKNLKKDDVLFMDFTMTWEGVCNRKITIS